MRALPLASSISAKLIVAFAAVVLLTIALASFLMERSTTSGFESYLMDRHLTEHHPDGMMPIDHGDTLAQMMGPEEDDFLSDVRRSLWISGGLTAAAALGLAIVTAGQITRPLRRLAAATTDIARGKLDTRIIGSGSDEIGRVGHAFNSMCEALQSQEELRKSMMADIAHELRTPLSVLQGNLEAMQDGLLQPTPEQVEALHDQTLALSRLVEDLRTLSLASTGHLELHRLPVDMGQLARGVVSEMEAAARDRRIELALETARDLPSLAVDRERIGQVLRNLLDNALRYTPEGGRVHVKVGVQRSELVVSVADTGVGIAPDDLAQVFDRFYRADESRARAGGGTGLGLAIVKQLVEAHGGQPWAKSEPERGSTFSFSLPLEERSPPA